MSPKNNVCALLYIQVLIAYKKEAVLTNSNKIGWQLIIFSVIKIILYRHTNMGNKEDVILPKIYILNFCERTSHYTFSCENQSVISAIFYWKKKQHKLNPYSKIVEYFRALQCLIVGVYISIKFKCYCEYPIVQTLHSTDLVGHVWILTSFLLQNAERYLLPWAECCNTTYAHWFNNNITK